jgi:pre-mRNA-splicing factor SYF1
VLLRQNPSDVPEWHKRVALYEARGDMRRVVETYTTALATVEPAAADGKLHSLWIKFAKFYESKPDAAAARDILDRATKVPYVAVDELVAVWCERAELEVRLKQPAVARDVSERTALCARALAQALTHSRS